MRKSFFIAAFAALTLIACNNNTSEENHEHNADGSHPQTEDTHAHDDGSVHNDHDADTTAKQEQFKVKQDSTAQDHDHSDPNHKH
jgi:hypothetical protein